MECGPSSDSLMLIHTLLVDSVIETEHISVFVGVAVGGQQVNYLSLPGDVVSRVHELQKTSDFSLIGWLPALSSIDVSSEEPTRRLAPPLQARPVIHRVAPSDGLRALRLWSLLNPLNAGLNPSPLDPHFVSLRPR